MKQGSVAARCFQTRSSGVLLHLTSLPGPHGCGDLGGARRFVDFLARAGQTWWQTLPIGPPGGAWSPYDSPSAFAGSSLLVSLETLHRRRWLTRSELAEPAGLASRDRCRYAAALRFRGARLRQAHARWRSGAGAGERSAFEHFAHANAWWLDDYGLFAALREVHARGTAWSEWDRELVLRRPRALATWRNRLRDRIEFHSFLQFEFERQWRELRDYCKRRGVRLLGDVPMFVAYDAADVWGNQELFALDRAGRRKVQAGVPPDYFSKTGQLWGNPIYRWDVLERTGFDWWLSRFRKLLERFDALRLDHFIGLHRYWEVAAGASSARHGRFRLVPGKKLLEHARALLGGLPFLAEDLGLLTREVHALRDEFELPGMQVLQFGFAEGAEIYQPHRYPRRCVVYTGTHDNDTLVGWLRARARCGDDPRRFRAERRRALAYAGARGQDVHWDFIRIALMSVANTAIFPMQDVLGLGSRARMNVPGTASGNWTWRLQDSELDVRVADRLGDLCSLYERTGGQS
jgi:4-alpha-glucanotransferase